MELKKLQVMLPIQVITELKVLSLRQGIPLKDIILEACNNYLLSSSTSSNTDTTITTNNSNTKVVQAIPEVQETPAPPTLQEVQETEVIKDDKYYEDRGIDWKVLSRKQTDGKPLTEFEQEAKDYDFEKFMKKVRAVEQQEAERLKLKAQQEQKKDKEYYESKGISWNDIRTKHSSGFPLTSFEQEAYDFDDAEYEKRRKEWKPDTEPYCPPNPFDSEYYDYDMSTGKTVKRDAPPEPMEDLHK